MKFNSMKRFCLSVFATCLCLFGCQVEGLYDANSGENLDAAEFYASIEDDGLTKTSLDEDHKIRWSSGDQVVIFAKSTNGLKYQIDDLSVGETSGTFSPLQPESSVDGADPGMSLDHNVAFYPYHAAAKCDKCGADYNITVTLPAEQEYAAESFGNGSFPMAAASENDDLTFRNMCGGMKLQLKGTCVVASVKVEGRDNEKLAGGASVIVYADDRKPSISMADDALTSVTLNCGEGVRLDESKITDFIISLPPVVFSKGFAITVTDVLGGVQVIETSKTNEVKRSSLLKMPEVSVNTVRQEKELSENGTANCYVVSQAGAYKFAPVKGNSSESVGAIASAEVLWETFGTDVTPNAGDLVKEVKYADSVISFKTPEAFAEGNAVIAAKDASGNILWSWHIWLTDEPEGQMYYNDAGTMMDRNLGATSATPGDVCALGLLYQWGRKDPFLASSSISSSDVAKSTITWPSAQSAYSIREDPIRHVTANPTTFIIDNSGKSDWYYSVYSPENTRWTESSSLKSIYDPCPVGWRVPDGGDNSVWYKVLSSTGSVNYNNVTKGMNFSGILGADENIWYPAAGSRDYYFGNLSNYGTSACCWTASPYMVNAYYMGFDTSSVFSRGTNRRANAYSVRCVQE